MHPSNLSAKELLKVFAESDLEIALQNQLDNTLRDLMWAQSEANQEINNLQFEVYNLQSEVEDLEEKVKKCQIKQ